MKTSTTGLWRVAALPLVVLWAAAASALELKSPDGRLRVSVEMQKAGGASCPTYTVFWQDRLVIAPSRLGFDLSGAPFASALKLTREIRGSSDLTWKPVYGERATARDQFNELTVTLEQDEPSRRLDLVLRAYDAGLAFCYRLPAQPALKRITLSRETTEFRFPSDWPTWATYTAQGLYTNVPLSQVRPGCERPLVIRAAADLYIALAEARQVDYARMKLAPLPGAARSLVSDLSGEVEAALPFQSPWRVIMVAESPGRLIENNDLLLNLNDPCALTNTAWIKPGKVLRDKSLTTAGGKACVDFAVKHNLQYILLDAGWYGPETSDTADARHVAIDPARREGPLDLPEVIRYARRHEIGVILYVNRRALERQLDDLLPLYRQWGVAGIKFGFVHVGSQIWTRWLYDSVRKAADYQFMVDVHDEFRPTGWSRTYPNLMTVEGISGDEQRQLNRQGLTSIFTRFLAGPADNTICYYDERVDGSSSHAFQLAKAVCFYSPWQCLYWYDRPLPAQAATPGKPADPNVIGDEPELEFFDRCPTVWDETRVLRGEIGEYAIFARRSGEDWWIGCMNANRSRTFNLPLDFLRPGSRYTAHVYSDDPSVATRTRVKIERMPVDHTTELKLAVSAQGGQAVRLVPAR